MSFTGSTPLQQFARLGLSLTIGDFRQLGAEINELLPDSSGLDDSEIVDVLFAWMTRKVEEAARAVEEAAQLQSQSQDLKPPLKPPSLVVEK